jgi:hypothetical protein
MNSMMNATDAHAETPFWVSRGRFHAQGTCLHRIGIDSLIIGGLAGSSDCQMGMRLIKPTIKIDKYRG